MVVSLGGGVEVRLVAVARRIELDGELQDIRENGDMAGCEPRCGKADDRAEDAAVAASNRSAERKRKFARGPCRRRSGARLAPGRRLRATARGRFRARRQSPKLPGLVPERPPAPVTVPEAEDFPPGRVAARDQTVDRAGEHHGQEGHVDDVLAALCDAPYEHADSDCPAGKDDGDPERIEDQVQAVHARLKTRRAPHDQGNGGNRRPDGQENVLARECHLRICCRRGAIMRKTH